MLAAVQEGEGLQLVGTSDTLLTTAAFAQWFKTSVYPASASTYLARHATITV